MPKEPRYHVICSRCYSCIIHKTNSKREADVYAVSHMNQYHHDVSIHDTRKE